MLCFACHLDYTLSNTQQGVLSSGYNGILCYIQEIWLTDAIESINK